MKNFIPILILFIIAVSCVDPRDDFQYIVEMKNMSSVSITVTTYSHNTLVDNIIIQNNERGLTCSYIEEAFHQYNNCNIDSIIIKFTNNEGYISRVGTITSYDFANQQTPFQPCDKFILNSNGVYQFTITEEDYQNAHPLP